MIQFKKLYYRLGAAVTFGYMGISTDAFATAPATTAASQNNVSTVTGNIVNSISNIPALLSALSYIAGLTIGTLGVLKVKDHVENPSQTPLKEGAIRLATGGALLSLPMLFDVLTNSFGSAGNMPGQDQLNALTNDARPAGAAN